GSATSRRRDHAGARGRRPDDHHHAALQHRPGGPAMSHSLDLFGAASPDGAWTVGEVTRQARAVLEAGLGPLWVRGEVSGFKAWQSGHWYFALRDRTAQLRCVMFQKDNRRLPGPPTDGMQVFVFGRPTVWEEKGEFRLTVIELLSTERGGLWQLAFEKAKAALQKDGLLDPARKRPLPLYPARLAIVTSKDGAAVRDIIAVTRRRWPSLELFVIPTKVQGDGAEDAICRALALLGRIDRLARGLGRRSERVTQRLDRTLDRLGSAVTLRLERQRHRLSAVSGRLDALSPLRILARGYALARDAEGRVLKRVAQFPPGSAFRLRVSDGEVAARATGEAS